MNSEESDTNPSNPSTDKDDGSIGESPNSEEPKSTHPSNFLPVYHVGLKFHTIPLVISIIISGVIAWYISSVVGFETVIPEENPGQGLVNGLVYTTFAVVSSVIIYFLVKKKGMNILRIIMSIAFLFLTFTLLLFFGILIFPILGTNAILYYLFMAFCVILALGLTYLYFSGKLPKIPRNIYVLAIGTMIGAFMGFAMPLWTTIVLLVGVSIWDIISVKRGPIKGIMEIMGQIEPGEVRNLSKEDFDNAEIQIGIGDIAFYSMLTSGCLINTGNTLLTGIQMTPLGSIITTIFAAIGILIGAFITIRALRKNAILPGLPLSILIGLVFAIVSYFILINIRYFYIYVV
ncbi:MAG: hypothetical protein EU530_00950 [Promethearchaeota archaeon]|nr:MAG: hypothetical protein EU530_00950 [Candidatus Lokiarchaeota archaeon]